MPDNDLNRILIKDIETTFSSDYPSGVSAGMPLVIIGFNLALKEGITDVASNIKVRIKSLRYCLTSSNNENGYEQPDESTKWISYTKEEISEMIVPSDGTQPMLRINWGINNSNKLYLTLQSKNYLLFEIKKFSELANIRDSQLHIKMSFEEVTESNGTFNPTKEGDTIFDIDGNSEIHFKTMKYTSAGGVIISTDAGIRTLSPGVGTIIDSTSYTNNSSFPVKIIEYSSFATHYAYSVNSNTISSWVRLPEAVDGEKELVINLGINSADGQYAVKIIVRDEYYNTTDASEVKVINITKSSTPPFDCEFNIYGQDGNSRYAGIRINPDGSFTPDRTVSVVFFANSQLPMTCRIFSSNNDVLIPKITSSVNEDGTVSVNVGTIDDSLKDATELDSSNSNCDTGVFDYKGTFSQDKERAINEIECYLVGPDYDTSVDREVTIVFTDIAGNQTFESKTIKLNNRIFMCEKKNLREQGSDYTHIVMKKNVNETFDTVPEAASGQEDAFKRMWSDIYFPDKQGPKMKGNDIDLEWCRAAYEQYTNNGNKFVYDDVESFGLISMEKDDEGEYQPKLDSEGRTISVWNNEKKYDPYVSRNRADIWFKVIDNTGYGDIKLEFERFNMTSTPGDMANATAGGYKGDVVMIYRADDSRCLTEVKNADGTISYPADGLNTVYMELLAVYSGKPGGVYDWFSGEAIRSNDTTGAFDVTFNCSKICIIVCTDSSKESSGFKIKAGKKIGLTYSNYDVDERNGELWYHGESDGWGSTDKAIRMFYDYYDSEVSFDYDKGFVIMNVNDLPEDAIVTCDYSYYKNKEDYNEEEESWLKGGVDDNSSIEHYRLYLASDDDFYEYMVPSVYVTPIGESINKDGAIYTPTNRVAGKFTDSYWAIDKDRGVIEINKYSDDNPDGNVPFNDNGYPMRITMDYTHHTFYRLSNDGYGNVHFEDKVIVADSTPVYPDATWADIRIINEGDSILENGKLIFKCRGEVESGSEEVKKPLDVNRPWDVQEGKKAVTWDRCRVYLSYTYDEKYFQFTPSISDLRRTYNEAEDKWGNSARLEKSTSEPYLAPKESLYGRIIWNLAGDTGNDLKDVQYPTDGLTVGRKSWSCEVSGKFYVVED